MSKLKLAKTVADAAVPEAKGYEIRDTTLPGFLLKVTPAGRKMFMVADTAANGQRRKPGIGRYGAITVEQARAIAQDWLAEVRRGGAQRRAIGRAPDTRHEGALRAPHRRVQPRTEQTVDGRRQPLLHSHAHPARTRQEEGAGHHTRGRRRG